MDSLLWAALTLGVVAALVWLVRNGSLLFVATVRQGQIVSLRGRAPQSLVQDFNAVLGMRPVPKARLRVVLRGGAPYLESCRTLHDAELQRLRNILGTYPLVKIRAAPFRSYHRSRGF